MSSGLVVSGLRAGYGAADVLHGVDLTVEPGQPTVLLRPGFPGLPSELKLTLPDLDMKDIGTADNNNNGAAIKDVVMLVLTEMASKAADSDQLPPELRQLLSLDTKQLTARLKQALALVEVRLLDHFVVGDGEPVSLAARGLV